VLDELTWRLRRPHRLPLEVPGLLPESFEPLLHELPDGPPRVARDRGSIRAGFRLATGARSATLTRPVIASPVLPGPAAPATV
jgi:hypothetical protein